MNRTKSAIVSAFGSLLSERPLSKITVKDIVECCGVNRNTFYYHFRDIPDLLEQVIREKTDQIIRMYSRPGSPMDCIAPVVQYCADHKKAILHIYRSVQREVFLTYLEHLSLHAVQEYVDAVTQGLFPPGKPVPERQLLVRYYKCTMVGGILDWMDAGMEYDLLAATDSICRLLAGSSRQAFLRCLGTAEHVSSPAAQA